MLLRGHGTITCGKDLQEAFFFTRFLDQACKVQVKLLSMNATFPPIADEICRKTKHDMLNFEKNLGERDFTTMIRALNSKCTF
jgi:ribulose-5-phosphate 4-epimerase/fuculose-1-phosphate aldolase